MRKEGSQTTHQLFQPKIKKQKIDSETNLKKSTNQSHVTQINNLFNGRKPGKNSQFNFNDDKKSYHLRNKKIITEKKVSCKDGEAKINTQDELFDEIVFYLFNYINGLKNASPPVIKDIKKFLSDLGLKNNEAVKQFYATNSGFGILNKAFIDENSYLLEFVNNCIQVYPTLRETILEKLSEDKFLLLHTFVAVEDGQKLRGDIETLSKFREIKIKILCEIDHTIEEFFQENKENMSNELRDEFEKISHQSEFSMRL